MDPHRDRRVVPAGRPLGQSRAVMIMIHGRNASPENILELAPRLGRSDFTYLAPAAAGNTWYPFSFLSETAKNEPDLTSAIHFLERVTDDVVAAGISLDRVILLGFSQGACLASEFAYRHPARYGGVLAFSGGLIGPPGTIWNRDGTFDRTPVFLGCSDADAHVPKLRVDESAAVFSRMDADVTERIYPAMGHLIADDEIAFARDLMNRVLPA